VGGGTIKEGRGQWGGRVTGVRGLKLEGKSWNWRLEEVV